MQCSFLLFSFLDFYLFVFIFIFSIRTHTVWWMFSDCPYYSRHKLVLLFLWLPQTVNQLWHWRITSWPENYSFPFLVPWLLHLKGLLSHHIVSTVYLFPHITEFVVKLEEITGVSVGVFSKDRYEHWHRRAVFRQREVNGERFEGSSMI